MREELQQRRGPNARWGTGTQMMKWVGWDRTRAAEAKVKQLEDEIGRLQAGIKRIADTADGASEMFFNPPLGACASDLYELLEKKEKAS
jgi:hypothetical protein